MNTKEILETILEERQSQNKQWGREWRNGSMAEREMSIAEYLLRAEHLIQKAKTAYLESPHDEPCLNEMKRAVAVMFTCFQTHGVPTRENKYISKPQTMESL